MNHPKASEKARITFQNKIKNYEKENRPIVYIDESGFAHDMPRTHGYADRGARCYDKQDWHAKGRINAIGAIIRFSFLTVSLINGSINSDVFYAWVTQDLLPKLPCEAVVVMDNAAFHKRNDIKQAFRNQNITLKYLPAYSPDLNPIEHKWAQAKSIRRRERCSTDELFTQHLDYGNL